MNTLEQLIQTINTQRRGRMMAGENHGTWKLMSPGETVFREELAGRVGYPVGYVVAEIEAVTGAPMVYRHITPSLTPREAEIFLRGAALALDRDEPGVWK